MTTISKFPHRIIESAYKHGIQDEDIEYVYKYSFSQRILREEPPKIMLFGYDTKGRGLEVGYFRDDNVNVIMHANKIRKVYEKYLTHWEKYQLLEELL